MLKHLSDLVLLLAELQQRKVVHVGILYGVGWYGSLQAVDVAVRTYGLPPGLQTVAGVILALGFPVALVLAWFFDWTPEGLRRAPPRRRHTRLPSRFLYFFYTSFAIGLLGVTAFALVTVSRAREMERQEGGASASPVLAILRIEDFSAGGDRGWLGEALRAGLVDALSRSQGVVVRSKEAVAAYEAAGLPPDSLARILGADFLVSGSLAASDEGTNVYIRLVEAATGKVLRSEVVRAAGESQSLATLEDLTNRTAEHLIAALGAEVRVRQWRSATDDATAFRLRFQAASLETTAREFVRMRDYRAAEEAYAEADELLAQAVAQAPDWPEPHLARASLADRRSILAMLSGQGSSVAHRWLLEGVEHTEGVLQRQPHHAAAIALRGTLRWRLYQLGELSREDAARTVDAAEGDLRAALRLDPTLAPAAATLSDLLHGTRAAFGEARVYARQAFELDAYQEHIIRILHLLAMTSLQLGEDSTALRWCRESLRRFPGDAVRHGCMLDVLAWSDLPPEPDTAWAHYRSLIEFAPPARQDGLHPYYAMAVASVLARAGLADSARAVMRQVSAHSAGDQPGGDPLTPLWLEAAVRFRLGEADSARALIARFEMESPESARRILARRALRDFVASPPSGDDN